MSNADHVPSESGPLPTDCGDPNRSLNLDGVLGAPEGSAYSAAVREHQGADASHPALRCAAYEDLQDLLDAHLLLDFDARILSEDSLFSVLSATRAPETTIAHAVGLLRQARAGAR